MMTSSRPRGAGGSFASRRGHGAKLSISDPSHHVTETIGTLYGDSDEDSAAHDARRDARPLSFIASPIGGEQIQKQVNGQADHADERLKLVRSTSEKSGLHLSVGGVGGVQTAGIKKAQTMPSRMAPNRTSSYDGLISPLPPMSPLSPTLSLRDVQADSQFPLTNIDNPNDIAQELSNLQALRRMSMDVGSTSDPDLPFQGMSLLAMPSIAPTGEDDEGDISRLLWVPAKVHPELAPDQFKNFLENRVQSMKRRSGESMLSIDGLQRNNSGSLRRKKSMLSRQIDNAGGKGAEGYVDGAERLERKKSLGVHGAPELSLNELVKDPSKVVQQLTQETQAEASMDDDAPILPVAPGMGLRRSTRTTYRKGGSLRSGDRVPFSKRVAARQAEKEGEETQQRSPRSSDLEAPPGHGLQRVQSEPVAENYSRPTRSVRRQQPFQRDAPAAAVSTSLAMPLDGSAIDSDDTLTSPNSTQTLPYRKLSSSADSRPSTAASIPSIVATPPPEEAPQAQPQRPFPQRSSSQKAASQMLPQQASDFHDEPPPRSSKRPSLGRPLHTSPPSTPASMDASPQSPSQQLNQTLNDMANHPSPLPGSGAARTDSLTFIPTLPVEEKRSEKKKEEGESSRSTGWKWFKSEDKEKKRKEKEREEQSRKSRARSATEKSQDKAHDSARLDVLQSSIDNAIAKGRESLLLDRESIDNKLHEERKKESSRGAGGPKKEKDGFFGSFFGGSKKKESKDAGKGKQRALSPEPPVRQLRPDVDYPYTRFPIVEERAIYRMAHIKLANPRRDLRSQVLLSNFMYSYLAKVQAMHPQLNVPISPQQKRQEEERKRREQEQQYLEQQQMQQQGGGQNNIDQYSFEYHRSSNQYGDADQPHDGNAEYADDSQMYDYDHGGHEGGDHPSQQNGGYVNHNDHGQQSHGGRNYYDYDHDDNRQDDDDMW